MSVNEKLLNIQTELKAPKSQYNSFGKYAYRNCEDILEALKPLLKKSKATLIINDEIVNISERFYVKATTKLIDIESGECIETTAYAREPENKKGLDESQITGSTSSYARKYSLNALFAIDDTKDSDYSAENTKPEQKIAPVKPITKDTQEEVNRKILDYAKISKRPVSEITGELNKVIKKELKSINETEARMVLNYMSGKINKELEGAS